MRSTAVVPLTNATIPNSVTSLGDYAFYNCSSLASVTFWATASPASEVTPSPA